jgi:hypothetical protein
LKKQTNFFYNSQQSGRQAPVVKKHYYVRFAVQAGLGTSLLQRKLSNRCVTNNYQTDSFWWTKKE